MSRSFDKLGQYLILFHFWNDLESKLHIWLSLMTSCAKPDASGQSSFAQRGALSGQVLLFDHGSVSNQSGPHIVSGLTRRIYFL